jgi:aminoglycoside phosphotransferase (APT) family kinase protein
MEAELAGDSVSTVLADIQGEKSITQWIERNVGGEVIKISRQGRWRPAWFVDMKENGAVKELYVRGARLHDFLPYRLDREFRIHQMLERGGIKVAHLYGYIPDVPAIVMDKVAGRHDLRHARTEENRQSVRRQLVRQMVKMHQLDTQSFREIGLRYPSNPRDTTLSFFDDMYTFYRQRKRIPNPRLEFLAGWLVRNAPPAKCEPRFTACDAGQFMYEEATLTAITDLELAVLGDPMQDLAALRRRTTYEPMGDIPDLFRMYEEESGFKIDLDAVRFHTVANATGGAIGAMLMMTYFLSAPTNDGAYVQFLNWVNNSSKQAFEGIAEVRGYELQEAEVPSPAVTAAHEPLFAIKATIDSLEETSPFLAYQKRSMLETNAYLERVASYGTYFAAQYLDEAAKLLGKRPHDIAEADKLLDAYVQQASKENEERIFFLLAKDVLRRCFMLAIPNSAYLEGLTRRIPPIA